MSEEALNAIALGIVVLGLISTIGARVVGDVWPESTAAKVLAALARVLPLDVVPRGPKS